MRMAILVLAGSGLAACNPVPAFVGVEGMQVARADQVAGCRSLGRFTTTPGVAGNIARTQAMNVARNATLDAAQNAGADTIVWISGGPDDPQAFIVEADAFNC